MATREQLIEDFADHKYATGEKFARLINSMKVVQEPVTDPQASGTSHSFIDSISQSADGKITATKKSVVLNYVQIQDKPTINGVTLMGDKTAAQLGLATANQVEVVSNKVDKLPSGYYYGKFGSVEDLPEATEKGYAYVASSDPTVFYTYLVSGAGAEWVDSGNKMVNTVDLTTPKTEDTKLSQGEKYYASANVNDRPAQVDSETETVVSMGYKVLNPAMSFASQVTAANTIYEIKNEFDLNGGSVTIPANCTLRFNGGKLSNGTITGANTVIDGNPLFKEITFAGSYVCKRVSSKDFEYATDDDALTAVFQFLNCIKKDVVCELEAKTYDIAYKSSLSGNTLFSKWKLDNCSNITINGNGAVINHTNPLTDIPAGLAQLNSILKLNSCTYITIKELTYQNLNGYDTNYQATYVNGVCVIFFEGNNSFLDISITVKNAETGLGNHIYAPANTNHIGLVSDSVFNVKQYHTGYGVTFSWVANSKINVESHGQHRGVYLTGASNCDVYLEWEDQWNAPIACIIGNSWTGGSDNLVWHSSQDLNIVSICTQETANANDSTVTKYCVGLGSGEVSRTIGLTMQNFNIVARNLHGVGEGFIADLSTDSTITDYFKNFTIKTQSSQRILLIAPTTRVLENFNIYDSKVSYFHSDIKSPISFVDSYIDRAFIGKGTYYFNKTDIRELMDNGGLSSKTNTKIFFNDCFTILSSSNLANLKATIVSNMLPYKQEYFWPFQTLYNGTNCDVSRVMMPNYRAKALNYGKLLIQTSNNGTSANRPQETEDRKTGIMYFDTTLKKPIWYNGTAWVDANGETVGLQITDTSVLIGAAQDSSKIINVYSASTITAISQVIDETSVQYTTGNTADTVESTSYYAGSAINLNEGDIIRIDGTAVILNSSKDAVVAFTSGKSYIASGTETVYLATTTADTTIVYVKGNWLETSVGTASGSTYPVTLKALSANSTAPRGAKVIITNTDGEVVIVNIIQSY